MRKKTAKKQKSRDKRPWYKNPLYMSPIIVAIIGALGGLITILPWHEPPLQLSTITGEVTDTNGKIVAAAIVRIDGLSATTNSSGVYEIPNVAPGTQTTTVQVAGTEFVTSPVTVTKGVPSERFDIRVPAATGLPVINYFTASPASISRGGSTILNWNVSNATSITIDNGVGSVSSSGNTVTYPDTTTTYTLTAANGAGGVTSTVQVMVVGSTPQQITSFKAKTYTNSQYGFSIQYPDDWVTRPELVSGDAVAAFGVPAFIPFVILYVIDADAPVTANWLVQSYTVQNNKDPKVILPPTETTLLNGSQATQSTMSYISQTGYEVRAFDIEVDKGGKRIRVMVGTVENFGPYNEVLFSEIARTLQFR